MNLSRHKFVNGVHFHLLILSMVSIEIRENAADLCFRSGRNLVLSNVKVLLSCFPFIIVYSIFKPSRPVQSLPTASQLIGKAYGKASDQACYVLRMKRKTENLSTKGSLM